MESGNTPFQSTTASALLDLVRGLAAIVVCVEHWRDVLFVDYRHIQSHKALLAIPYVLTGAGHQAVMIFFVLSGFLIGGSVFRSFKKGKWSWVSYLTHRLVRLWLVLIPALLVGGLLDIVGIHLGLAPNLYAGEIPNHILSNVARALNPLTFAGNVLFLQGIFVHTFGSNGPLWSLANEFWYYILFPCGVILWRSTSSVLARMLAGALLVGIALMVGRDILLAFPIWLLGALLAKTPVPRIARYWRVFVGILYVPVFFFLAKTSLLKGLASDYVLGCATFVLLWMFLDERSSADNEVWVKFARRSARFSYTLYLVHLPCIVFIASLITHDSRWQPTGEHIVLGLGILLVVVGYAYVIAAFTEFRTDEVRRWVEARILRNTAKRAAAAPH